MIVAFTAFKMIVQNGSPDPLRPKPDFSMNFQKDAHRSGKPETIETGLAQIIST